MGAARRNRHRSRSTQRPLQVRRSNGFAIEGNFPRRSEQAPEFPGACPTRLGRSFAKPKVLADLGSVRFAWPSGCSIPSQPGSRSNDSVLNNIPPASIDSWLGILDFA